MPKYLVDCRCDRSEDPPDYNSSAESIFDWWSFTHILWGMFFSLSMLFIPAILSFVLVLCLAVLWELYENMPNAYIPCCMERGYSGDNIYNSIADVFCNMIGYGIVYISLNNF